MLTAQGTGCRLELEGNRLHIVKGGPFGLLVSLLGFEGGFVDRTLKVSDISAIEVDRPLFMFRYMRFSYPGAPEQTGHVVKDMLAENAVVLSLWDNRSLFAIKEAIKQAMDAAING